MLSAHVLRAHLLVLASAALFLTACGSEETRAESSGGESSASPSAGGETAPPGTPDCTSVWRDGATLPPGYGGCVEDAEFVSRDALGCSSGQRIIRSADHFYAVPGGTVHSSTKPLDRDRKYRAAVYRCRA
jgi:hypothetical protein